MRRRINFSLKSSGPKLADPSMSTYSTVNFTGLWLFECSDAAAAADYEVAPPTPIKMGRRAAAADYKTAKRRRRPSRRRRTALAITLHQLHLYFLSPSGIQTDRHQCTPCLKKVPLLFLQ